MARAPYAYVEAKLPDGYDQPLFRLRWTNNRDRWAFAIWLASKDGYEASMLPSGALAGTGRRGDGLRLWPLPERHQRLGITPSTLPPH